MTCWFRLFGFAFAAWAHVAAAAFPQIAPAPNGPYHVDGNRILDRSGNPYLIRGTALPPIGVKDSFPDFGEYSGTTFITIRQRLNMNAVRLRVDDEAYQHDEFYRQRGLRPPRCAGSCRE